MSKKSPLFKLTSKASSDPADVHVSKQQEVEPMESVVSAAAYYGLEQILPRTIEMPNELTDSEVLADSESV